MSERSIVHGGGSEDRRSIDRRGERRKSWSNRARDLPTPPRPPAIASLKPLRVCICVCVCVYIYECSCALARVSFLAYAVLQAEVARIVRFAIIRVGNMRASYSLHLLLSRLSFSLFAHMYLCMYVCITCLVFMRLRDTLDVLLGS